MKLQVSGGIDSLTLIEEHGNTVCAFAVCDEEARQVANEIVRRFNAHDEFRNHLGEMIRIASEDHPGYMVNCFDCECVDRATKFYEQAKS